MKDEGEDMLVDERIRWKDDSRRKDGGEKETMDRRLPQQMTDKARRKRQRREQQWEQVLIY